MTYATSVDSDQSAHPRCVIRIYTGRKRMGLKHSVSEQRRPGSDCADAQADLGLRWSHMSSDRFLPGGIYIIIASVMYGVTLLPVPSQALQNASIFLSKALTFKQKFKESDMSFKFPLTGNDIKWLRCMHSTWNWLNRERMFSKMVLVVSLPDPNPVSSV